MSLKIKKYPLTDTPARNKLEKVVPFTRGEVMLTAIPATHDVAKFCKPGEGINTCSRFVRRHFEYGDCCAMHEPQALKEVNTLLRDNNNELLEAHCDGPPRFSRPIQISRR